MQLCNLGHNFDYETEKVMRIFMPFEKITVIHNRASGDNTAVCEVLPDNGGYLAVACVNIAGKTASECEKVVLSASPKELELAVARCLYKCLSKITGYKSEWGILTGIRPAKLFASLRDTAGEAAAKSVFKNSYLAGDNKISLCASAAKSEEKTVALSKPNSFSVYISIPFCPSRCSYCSFVSHSVENAKQIIPKYLDLLKEEIMLTGNIARDIGLKLESVYIGGGTPTSITAESLDKILYCVRESFDFSTCREFTVEAGRPDTVDREKLDIIKKAGATRISINPQTMNEDVLKTIGRRHTAGKMKEAFYLAREAGFNNINTDLIAGLPGDTADSFKKSVNDILNLCPESVTVHSLSVKRAADITRKNNLPDTAAGETAALMVDYARETLEANGLLPYYMYRQSKTVGNLENVGYAKPGFEGLYNVFIMDETHTILACGASAVTKLKQPLGNNIERIFNFKYPYEYINRFDEIKARKSGVAQYYCKYPFK